MTKDLTIELPSKPLTDTQFDFLKAIANYDEAAAKQLLDADNSLANLSDPFNLLEGYSNPLLFLVGKSKFSPWKTLPMLRLLLQYQPDTSVCTSEGLTAVHLAALNTDEEILVLFAEQGIDLTLKAPPLVKRFHQMQDEKYKETLRRALSYTRCVKTESASGPDIYDEQLAEFHQDLAITAIHKRLLALGSLEALAISSQNKNMLMVCIEYGLEPPEELFSIIDELLKVERKLDNIRFLLSSKRLLLKAQSLTKIYEISRSIKALSQEEPYGLKCRIETMIIAIENDDEFALINALNGLTEYCKSANPPYSSLFEQLSALLKPLYPDSFNIVLPEIPSKVKNIEKEKADMIQDIGRERSLNRMHYLQNLRSFKTGPDIKIKQDSKEESVGTILVYQWSPTYLLCDVVGIDNQWNTVTLTTPPPESLTPESIEPLKDSILAELRQKKYIYCSEDEIEQHYLQRERQLSAQKALLEHGTPLVIAILKKRPIVELIPLLQSEPINELLLKVVNLYQSTPEDYYSGKVYYNGIVTLLMRAPALSAFLAAKQDFKSAWPKANPHWESLQKKLEDFIKSIGSYFMFPPLFDLRELLSEAEYITVSQLYNNLESTIFALCNANICPPVPEETPNTPTLPTDSVPIEEQEFLAAVKRGNVIHVQELLSSATSKINLDVIDDVESIDHHSNALLSAAAQGNLPLVVFLIENGANVNIRSPKGLTPLYVALGNAHFELADFLVKKGAVLNYPQDEGQIKHIESEKIQLIQQFHDLISYPAEEDQSQLDKKKQQLSIKLAILNLTHNLLKNGIIGMLVANPRQGMNIIHFLFQQGDLPKCDITSLKTLINLYQLLGHEQPSESAELQNAIRFLEKTKPLTKLKKAIEVYNKYCNTLEENQWPGMQAEMNSLKDDFNSLLEKFMQESMPNFPNGFFEYLPYLPDTLTKIQQLSIMKFYRAIQEAFVALMNPQFETQLFDHLINDPLTQEEATLFKAVREGDIEIAQQLLDGHPEIRINIADPLRDLDPNMKVATLLGLAIISGSFSMVELILNHNPNTNVLDKNGASMIQLAMELEDPDILTLLLEHGARCDIPYGSECLKEFETKLNTKILDFHRDSYEGKHTTPVEQNEEKQRLEKEIQVYNLLQRLLPIATPVVNAVLMRRMDLLKICLPYNHLTKEQIDLLDAYFELFPDTSNASIQTLLHTVEPLQATLEKLAAFDKHSLGQDNPPSELRTSFEQKVKEYIGEFTEGDTRLNNLQSTVNSARLLARAQQFQDLFAAITELENYGETLKLDKNSQTFGEKACHLALQLRAQADAYMTAFVNGDKEKIRELQASFEPTLKQGNTDMGEHRTIIRPILLNLIIAATGIGLIVILVRLCMGLGFFNTETEREKRFNKVLDAQDKLHLLAWLEEEVPYTGPDMDFKHEVLAPV